MRLENIKPINKMKVLLLQEDLDSSEVIKITNINEIKETINLYNEDNYIIINNPTNEQKQNILDYLLKSCNGDLGKMKLSGSELLAYIAPRITSLKFNPKKKSDIKKIELLLTPNKIPPIIAMLDRELGIILNQIISDYLESVKIISDLPDEQQELLLKQLEIQQKMIEQSKTVEELQKKAEHINGYI